MIFDINLVIHFETSFFLYLALSNIPSEVVGDRYHLDNQM
jgi:hypothetical protein